MNHEMFPTPPSRTETGVEKRREVAERVRELYDAALEAAREMMREQGGVTIREKPVSIKPGYEGPDLFYTASRLFHESLEQERVAAEEKRDFEKAGQFALAQDFAKNHHGSVAAYLDARNAYPELTEIIEDLYPNFPKMLAEAQEAYVQ